jgi:hypothetical protein
MRTPRLDAPMGLPDREHLRESATVCGRDAFLTEARRLPGVTVIEGEGPLEERPITVVVPGIRGQEASAVFQLEADVYRRFPGARLSIEVEEGSVD